MAEDQKVTFNELQKTVLAPVLERDVKSEVVEEAEKGRDSE